MDETTAAAASRLVDSPIVCVRVAVVNLPVGAASEGEEIWARLQGDAIGAERSKTLQANGLRVGLGQARTLVDLVGVLEALTGREILYAVIPAVSATPRSLSLRENEPPRTFFTVSRDGSASGADYPGGEYVLTVGGRVSKDAPSRILLTVMPQIRPANVETRIVRTGGHVAFRTYQRIFGFEEATVTVNMSAGDVLVIGPSRESRRTSSIGHSFLTGGTEGLPFEIILLMIPEVVTPSPR